MIGGRGGPPTAATINLTPFSLPGLYRRFREIKTGASLREIGRKVAAEVEKYFEAKVNPRTIEKKAERVAATNVAPKENTTKTEGKGGDTGDKYTILEPKK